MPANANARRVCGRRLAKRDAGALEEEGELLVDWVRDVFQLVRGGKGQFLLLKALEYKLMPCALRRNEEQNWVCGVNCSEK